MKVKDKLSNLFTSLEVKKPLLIFEHMDSTILDQIYINMYGEKTLSKIGNLDMDLITDMIVNMYADKWDRGIENFLKSIIDITEGGYKVIENSTNEDINSLTRNVINKVSAYNDDTMAENVEDSEELAGTNTGKNDLEKNVINKISIDNIIKIINYLNNYYMYDIMMVDINELLTMKIYV